MTYFIGGNQSGKAVEQDEMDRNGDALLKQYGPYTGMSRPTDRYIKTKINFQGTIKTFYIIDGEKPMAHKNLILELWESVKTDVYAIN